MATACRIWRWCSGNNTVSIFTGFGDGSFTLKTTLNVGTSPSFVAVTDFNGDGDADLAVANQLSNNVYTFLGNGDGRLRGGRRRRLGATLGASPWAISTVTANPTSRSLISQ